MRVALTDEDVYEISKGGCIDAIADDDQEVQLGPLDFTGQQLDTLKADGEMTVHLGDLQVTVTAEAAPRGKLYLVTVEGGVTPEVHGPFRDDGERVAEGRRLHAAQDPDTDAVFLAEVTADGGLRVDSLSGAFFEDEEPAR